MTNTNELTAKLKAAAQEALQPHERLSVLPLDDIFDISLAEGTQLDADITAVNAFHDEATPANILALTEALEAANELNKHLELATRKAEGCSEALRRRAEAAEQHAQRGWKEAHEQEARAEAADNRIASLEARTLTVKLPDYVDGHTLGYGEVNHMIDLCADAFEKACHRADIKLQIEGE